MKNKDWEEDLAGLVGDPLAFQIGFRLRELNGALHNGKQDLSQMLSEYLSYELNLLPAAHQVSDFCQQVQTTQQATDALEQRLLQLTQTHSKPDASYEPV